MPRRPSTAQWTAPHTPPTAATHTPPPPAASLALSDLAPAESPIGSETTSAGPIAT
jgi:hypothetical protein